MKAEWNDKTRAMLGLCMKSGNCVSGDTQVESAIRKNRVKLVLVSSEASENTVEKYTQLCEKKHIMIVNGPDKESLGTAIGKGNRTLVAITDTHWAKTMLDTMGVQTWQN